MRNEWRDDQKALLIAQILGGETTVQVACEEHGLSPDEIREWVEVYRRSARHALDDQLAKILASQGIQADALNAAEFNGTLQDIPLADLLQTVEMGRKDGVITVTDGNSESRIWLMGGQVVDAESGDLKGEPAFYRILNLKMGEVAARFHTVQREKRISISVPGLLLEASRRKDECELLRQRLGENIICARERPRSEADPQKLNPVALKILELLDGSRTVDEVVEDSSLGDLETLHIISRLLDMGYAVRTKRNQPVRLKQISKAESESPKRISFSSLIPPAKIRESSDAQKSGRRRAVMVILVVLAFGVIGGYMVLARDRDAAKEPSGMPDSSTGKTAAAKGDGAPPRSSDYQVDIKTHPRSAEIWLDGKKVATGRLSLRLPRDGRTHEMKILDDDYLPQTLLFTDAAPPSQIRLQKMKKKEEEEEEPVQTDTFQERSSDLSEQPLGQQPRPAPGPATKPAREPVLPKVRIIDDEEPPVPAVD